MLWFEILCLQLGHYKSDDVVLHSTCFLKLKYSINNAQCSKKIWCVVQTAYTKPSLFWERFCLSVFYWVKCLVLNKTAKEKLRCQTLSKAKRMSQKAFSLFWKLSLPKLPTYISFTIERAIIGVKWNGTVVQTTFTDGLNVDELWIIRCFLIGQHCKHCKLTL